MHELNFEEQYLKTWENAKSYILGECITFLVSESEPSDGGRIGCKQSECCLHGLDVGIAGDLERHRKSDVYRAYVIWKCTMLHYHIW